MPKAAKKPKRKTGRPTDYRPEYAEQAAKLCLQGYTDAQLAVYFDVALSTFKEWKGKHPDLSGCLKAAKGEADEIVERSLYERAIGYTHPAVKIFMPAGATEPVFAHYDEHIAPDTTAGIFWLKNRKPDAWRDKHDVQHSGTVTLEGLVTESYNKDGVVAGAPGCEARTEQSVSPRSPSAASPDK